MLDFNGELSNLTGFFTDSDGGYMLGEYIGANVLDRKRKSASIKFGNVMAKILSLPPAEIIETLVDTAAGNEPGSPSDIRDKVLVSLTSCETATSTLIAVGAELRLFWDYFSSGFSLPVVHQHAVIRKLSSHSSRFFLNNAIEKIFSHLDRVAHIASERVHSLLGEDSTDGAVWLEIWDAAIRQHSVEEEREANKDLLRCLSIAWRLDFNLQFLKLRLMVASQEVTEASARNSLNEMLQRIFKKGKTLQSRAKTAKNSTSALTAFGSLADILASTFENDLIIWEPTSNRERFYTRVHAEKLDRDLSEASTIFQQIDNRYRERNSISSVDRFENVLVLQLSFNSDTNSGKSNLTKGLSHEIRSQVARANSNVTPRAYKFGAVKEARLQLIELRTSESDLTVEYRLFGRGNGIADWYGFIVGKFLAYDDYESCGARPAWISILGIDESRRFTRSQDSDQFVMSPLIEEMLVDEMRTSTAQGLAIASGHHEVRTKLLQRFHEEYAGSLKSQAAERRQNDVDVDALGGPVAVARYEWRDHLHNMVKSAATAQLNVLIFATEWASHHGGLSTFNRTLCITWAAAGARVVCVAAEASLQDKSNAKAQGVEILVPGREAGADPSTGLVRSFRLPVGFSPDVVVGHGRITGPAATGQVKDRFQSAQLVHFVHMAPGEIESLKYEVGAARSSEDREKIERTLAKDATVVVAVGQWLFDEFENVLAGLNVPLHLFEPGLTDQRQASPLAKTHCLVVGRVEDVRLKGLDIAARALAHVVKKINSLGAKPELIVRGAAKNADGELVAKLKEQCMGIDLAIRVREYSGDEDTIDTDLRRAAVLLMPSRREGFGLVALEALSVGIPVLATDKSGFARMIQAHAPEFLDTVIVSTDHDVEVASLVWANAIELVLKDKQAAFDRSKRLQGKLRKSVSWANSVDKLAEKLQNLAQTRTRV